MNSNYQVEICVDSVESAVAAEQGGADRIELCQNLFEGGTTPSKGMIEMVRETVKIPIFVMLRPRGGDFCYTEAEREMMFRDLATAKAIGVDGVVFGALNVDGTVDQEITATMKEHAKPLSLTFHRAFDMARDPQEAVDCLLTMGVERLLTSGQAKSALEGTETIANLVSTAGRRLIVMPGGGINEKNVARIKRETGAEEFHFSASHSVASPMTYQYQGCFMGKELRPPEFRRTFVDAERVNALRRSLEAS